MEGFRFLVPLVRPGWKIIKRTFIADKGEGLGRKERKRLGFTIYPAEGGLVCGEDRQQSGGSLGSYQVG